jgi:uncharacterized protein
MEPVEENRKPDLAQLLPCLRAALPGILAEKPVMLAYLYGSVAEGHPLPFSDMDIALILRPDNQLSAYERMLLEFDIAAEVETRCGVREADVRSLDAAPLTAQGQVVTEGILLYSRDTEFRIEYETRTRKLYFDFKPAAEMLREAFFARIREEGLLGKR